MRRTRERRIRQGLPPDWLARYKSFSAIMDGIDWAGPEAFIGALGASGKEQNQVGRRYPGMSGGALGESGQKPAGRPRDGEGVG
jgi:hypothetical protein